MELLCVVFVNFYWFFAEWIIYMEERERGELPNITRITIIKDEKIRL